MKINKNVFVKRMKVSEGKVWNILSSLFVAFILKMTVCVIGIGTIMLQTGCGEEPQMHIMEDTEKSAEESQMNIGEETKESAEENLDEELNNMSSDELQEETIAVHMCGAVVNPGVYELPKGSRITDGVTMAGGFTDDANGNALNLAQVLEDQSRVYVPTYAESEALQAAEALGVYLPENASDTSEHESELININTANSDRLQQLPGVGQTRAESIIAYREEHGPFKNREDIKNVSGIGDASYEKLKDKITVN